MLQWILTAGRFPADPSVLDGGVLLLESSEDLIPASEFGYITRSLGERGLLAAVDAVVVARAAAATRERRRGRPESRAAHRAAQRDVAIETVAALQPGRGRRRRRALRAHAAAVGPPVRRHDDRRLSGTEGLGGL